MKGQNETDPIWVIGTMSGTSLDGVDAAVIQTDGHAIYEFGASSYRPYTSEEQQILRDALGLWPGDDKRREAAALEVVQHAHAEVVADLEGEMVGFHGQTLAHDPGGKGTFQLGDGAALAQALGKTVVWDFRSADVGLGGQGAPLAPFFHYACAQYANLREPVAFLNLGGVGNLTWVDPRKHSPEEDGALLAFDTGPANAPINDLMAERLAQPYDKGGACAAKGKVAEGTLELFLKDAYFHRCPPKSLDRDDFALMLDLVRELSDEDAAATMTAMAATSVMLGMEHCPSPPTRLFVCGGGRHNPVMMEMLAASIDCTVEAVEAIGLDGDMLEAQAFAYLAVRANLGLPTSAPSTTGVVMPVGGGRVSKVN